MKLKLTRPIVFFDLEATGLDPVKEHIVQFTVIRVEPNQSQRTWTSLVNPLIPIPVDAFNVHGISDEDVADASSFADLADELFQFFEGADIGGYNILKYDIPLLSEEFARCSINFDMSARKIVDAFQIFSQKESRTLTKALDFYCGEKLEGAHGSEVDTVATIKVLEGQLDYYDDIPSDVEALDQQFVPEYFRANVDPQGKLRYKDGQIVLGFGKHRDRPLADLAKREPGYLRFMLEGDFSLVVKQACRAALEQG